MKNWSLALMLLLAIGSFANVYASDGADDSMNDETEQHSSMEDSSNDDAGMDDSSHREPVTKFNVSEKKRKNDDSMEHAKPAMPQLTEDQKAQLEALKTEFKAALEEIKKAMDAATTEDEKKALMEKMKAVMEDHKKKMQEIVPMMGEMHDKMKNMPKSGDGMMSDEMKKKMQEMMKKKMEGMKNPMMGSGSMMNDDMKKKMEGNGRDSGKGKYKEMFAKKLAGKLEGMTSEKLQSILGKLEATEAKIKENSSMDEARKAKLLAQLGALKEIVREAIDQKDTESELNLDELFQ